MVIGITNYECKIGGGSALVLPPQKRATSLCLKTIFGEPDEKS